MRKPFKQVINAALSVGLDEILAPPVARPYQTKARPLGLRQGLSYDNVSELLAPVARPHVRASQPSRTEQLEV